MPTLDVPTTAVHASFLTAIEELAPEGVWPYSDLSVDELRSAEAFAAYVEAVKADADSATPNPLGFLPATHLWFRDDALYIGRLTIRHAPPPERMASVGNIGYDVRPSQRRKGHAAAMLRAAIPIARGLGVAEPVLVIDRSNEGSRRVVKANGGVLFDAGPDSLHYRIPTP